MTVKDLIKQLQSLPKNLEVYAATGEHGEFETDWLSGSVEMVDKDNMTESNNDKNSGISDCFKDTPNKYVVIRQ